MLNTIVAHKISRSFLGLISRIQATYLKNPANQHKRVKVIVLLKDVRNKNKR
jgi:hypothetical protein